MTNSVISVSGTPDLREFRSLCMISSAATVNIDMMKNEEKLVVVSFYRSMKLEKYGFKLKTSEFVSFLAWTGIMIGIVGILLSLELLIFPTDFVVSYDFLFYFGGIVGILTSTTWIALSLALRKRNVEKDFRGIIKILKIKCCLTGTFEIISSILGIAVSILIVVTTSDHQNWLWGFGFLLYLTFACCKIYGLRTDNNRYINSYIVFKMINFVLCVALGIFIYVYLCQNIYLVTSVGTLWILLIFGVIVISFLFIYYIGPVVALYNFNHHFDSKMNNVYFSI